MSIRVAVVDDQALVRSGFAVMLGLQKDIEVVAEAGDGVAAIEIARTHRPDVILMDEPLANLDAHLRAGGRVEVKRVQRDLGITDLYTLARADGSDKQRPLAANIDQIKIANEWGVIDGVTTNPSLIAKEGKDFKKVVKAAKECSKRMIRVRKVAARKGGRK